jgi:hypothetical protein
LAEQPFFSAAEMEVACGIVQRSIPVAPAKESVQLVEAGGRKALMAGRGQR